MDHDKKKEKITRYTLGVLLALLAINAFGGGAYGLSGARDVPAEWLRGSPFNSYFIPSLILIICVGASALLAAIAVFKKHILAHKAALAAAVIVLGWIIAQLLIIGYVSWLQPTIAIAGICILLLTWLLSKQTT